MALPPGSHNSKGCSIVLSLTRLDVTSLLACRSMPHGRSVSNKMLKMSVVAALLMKELG